MNLLLRLFTCLLLALAAPVFAAELRDTPPVDEKQILELLGKLRQQQETSMKQRRATAFDVVRAATGSGEKAAALWKEAVKNVQFEGAGDEASKVRAWRENDGEALNSKEAQTAARLHMTWLFLTLQFHSGVKKKDLVPLVIDYTNQLVADGQTMDTLEDQLRKEKEREKQGARRDNNDEQAVKRMHDSILQTSVSGGPIAKYLRLEDVLPRGPSQNDRVAKSVAKILGVNQAATASDDAWPMVPGDLEGIHQALILPEYRAAKDPRILEYWERIIRRETEAVAKKKVDYEEKRFAEIRRPELFWGRAQDLYSIGLRNRAITEMVAVVRANPLHPSADGWISQLEGYMGAPARNTTAAAPTPATTPAPKVPAAP